MDNASLKKLIDEKQGLALQLLKLKKQGRSAPELELQVARLQQQIDASR
ncbi:MAG: hypothetical protein RBJ76_03255 [Stenomitos frigidus ULC029]